MKDECLICKAPLEYLEEDVLMECAVCHKKENSKTRCVNGRETGRDDGAERYLLLPQRDEQSMYRKQMPVQSHESIKQYNEKCTPKVRHF